MKAHRLWLWMIPLLLLAAAISARGLDADAIWVDEYWSVYNAGGAHYGPITPAGIIERISTGDIWHVPLYYFVLAAWESVVGASHVALRALSLLIGLLSIAFAYRLGSDIYSPLAGLAAAVTLGVSAYYLYYFHEMRSYTLNVLVVEVTLWAYWRAVHGMARRGLYAGVFFAAALATLYTHYLAALMLGALTVYHLIVPRKDRAWWRVTLAGAGAAVLFLPWVGVTLRAWQEAASSVERLTQGRFPDPIALYPQIGEAFSNGALLIVLVLIAASLHPHGGKRSHGAVFSLWLLIAACGFALALNLIFTRFMMLRYALPIFPVLALLCGIGIARLAQRGVSSRLLLGAWTIAGVWAAFSPTFASTYLDNRLLSPPWHTITRALETRATPNDLVVYALPYQHWHVWQIRPTDYHFHAVKKSKRIDLALVESSPHITDAQYESWAGGINARRVWLGADPANPPAALLRYQALLAQRYTMCDAPIIVDGARLDLYTRILRDMDYIIGGGVYINTLEPVLYDAESVQVIMGVAVRERFDAGRYSLGVHLLDAGGVLVAQADAALPQPPYACVVRRIDLSALPAGVYTLSAVVYDWQTLERLTDMGGVDQIPLGIVTLE